MILSILLTTLLQNPAPPPALATEAIYLVQQGPHRQDGDIERLLAAWSRERVIRRGTPPQKASKFDACMPRRHWDPMDVDCVRRLLPASTTQVPAVAIIARDSGVRSLVWHVHCVGPHGAGEASLRSGDAFRTDVRTRNEARLAIAGCISRALPGAVQFRPDALPEPIRVAIPFQQQFGVQGVAEARRAASDVAVISADHVGYPRGYWGHCKVTGWVVRPELGNALRPRPEGGGTAVEVSIPCGSPPRTAPRRQVARKDVYEGALIRLFVGRNLTLLHAETIDEEGLPVFIPAEDGP
jgi:hypothetical protein